MHCKSAGHSVAIFGLLAKTQSTCLLRVLFARRLCRDAFWSDANHEHLQAKATYRESNALPYFHLRILKTRYGKSHAGERAAGIGAAKRLAQLLLRIVALKRAHERPQGASSEARWSSAHPRRSKCNAEVDSECKFARAARDNAPWHILASQSNLPGEQCSPLVYSFCR